MAYDRQMFEIIPVTLTGITPHGEVEARYSIFEYDSRGYDEAMDAFVSYAGQMGSFPSQSFNADTKSPVELLIADGAYRLP